MDVELYADPSCPWSWAACLWLDAVAPRRQLRLIHRPFSLALRDGTAHLPARLRDLREASHRALRVAAVVQDARRWAFFTALSGQLFGALGQGASRLDIADALDAAGVHPGLAGRADDAALDDAIRSSMAGLADALPGSDPASQKIPVVVVSTTEGRVAYHGPLLDPVPTGRAAVALWDSLDVLARVPGVFEISRPRPHPHSFVRAAVAAH